MCRGLSHVSAWAELQSSIREITDFGYYGVLLSFIITGYIISNRTLDRAIAFIDKYTYAIYLTQGIVFYLLIEGIGSYAADRICGMQEYKLCLKI